jgi:hypothetical protein
VGGDLLVYGQATLQAPDRDKIGNNPKPIFKVFKKKGYLLCDNILSKIISKKEAGEIVMWKTRKIGSQKILYVAQKGELFSHGETPKQASHDLRYKITDRDTTFCKGWTLDSVQPIADIIRAYRAITGACETGTRMWCEGKDIPEKLSIKAAIEKTAGAYQADVFAKFFKAEAK